jgi:hypothetical protein
MVSSLERKPLINRLNLTDKELRWVYPIEEPKYNSLAEKFGDSRMASTLMMGVREFVAHDLSWQQFGLTSAETVIADEKWSTVLQWLADHPYALLVGDKQLAQKQKRRNKIDIEFSLENEAPKEWVGPHRYVAEKSMFDQSDTADEEGINCQVTAHLVAEYRGKKLDRGERSGELFENYQVFDPTEQPLEIGDIVFFHERQSITDPKSLHLATVIGWDIVGVPLLLHATSQVIKSRPGAEVIPISQLLTNRTRFCYGAVRLYN